MQFEKIKNITESIRSDIFQTEEAIYLLKYIGNNSEKINENYGIFFGRIQRILEEYIINLLSKIFEKPKDYPLNSIPALRKHLKHAKDELIKFENYKEDNFLNSTTESLLEKIGINNIQQKSPLSDLIIKKMGQHFGNTKKIRTEIKNWRNKVYNHHERLNHEAVDLEYISLREKTNLLNDAKIYLSIIENIYLDVNTVNYEGEQYLPTEDAKSATIILNNLLIDTGLLERREARKDIQSLFKE